MGRILDQVSPEQSMEDIPIISRSHHLSNGTERRHHLQVEEAEQQPGTSASTATSSDTGPTNVRKRETTISQTQHQQQHQAANNDLNKKRLETEWIPRYENEIADAYSKIFDFDDWSVGDHIFQLFNRKWGSYEYDLFADCNNNKLEIFYSRFWNPFTA